MITAGIDVGIEYTKAVVMIDGVLAGFGTAVSGGEGRNDAAQSAFDAALAQAGIDAGSVGRVLATGKGKYDVKFRNDEYTEAVALGRGVKYLVPGATMAVNFGADEILAIVLGENGRLPEVVLNQKCSAGVGIFLRTMARRLELSLEELSAADVSGDDVGTSDGCVVFAEMGALTMLNHGRPVHEVASAVTKAAAVRAATVLNDIILPDRGCVVYTGGLTKNAAFMTALEQRMPMSHSIPENAEFVCAIGAAVLAAEV